MDLTTVTHFVKNAVISNICILHPGVQLDAVFAEYKVCFPVRKAAVVFDLALHILAQKNLDEFFGIVVELGRVKPAGDGSEAVLVVDLARARAVRIDNCHLDEDVFTSNVMYAPNSSRVITLEPCGG